MRYDYESDALHAVLEARKLLMETRATGTGGRDLALELAEDFYAEKLGEFWNGVCAKSLDALDAREYEDRMSQYL